MIDLFSNIFNYLNLRMRTYSENWPSTSLLTHFYLYFGQQRIVASDCFIPTCNLILDDTLIPTADMTKLKQNVIIKLPYISVCNTNLPQGMSGKKIVFSTQQQTYFCPQTCFFFFSTYKHILFHLAL